MPASSASASLRSLRPEAAREAASASSRLASSTVTASAARASSRQLGVALLGRLGQRPRDHLVELRRQLGPVLAHSRRLGVQVGEHHCDVGVAAERRLPDKALVEHAAERVDVGTSVELLAGDLLGSDVVDRAHQLSVVTEPGLLGEPLGEPEVGQVGVVGPVRAGAGVEQDVGGLHVPVHEPARMRCIERAGDLRENGDRLARLEPPTPQTLLQVAPST